MARDPAAQTAFGPMVQVAIEQYEPPGRRLVDDDLARAILPAGQRALVGALRVSPLRRLTVSAGERSVPGAWALITCRKRFIDDKLAAALDDVDTVVILGAGMDTRGYRLARRSGVPVFEVDLPVNIARKKAALHRIGKVPESLHLVAVDFERDDLFASLARHGLQSDARSFFVMEGVTQYLAEEAVAATFAALETAAAGSRLVFTYVRKDFIDGRNTYGAELLYKRFRQRRQVWKFGIEPGDVADFIAEYGWTLVEQAGPDYYQKHYLNPAGRDLAASELEWAVHAEKV